MKSIDIRSESAIKLLAEFLDMDAPYVDGGRHVNAEHFSHELYSYLRSPFNDLTVYDSVVQYDSSPDAPPPYGTRSDQYISNSPGPSRWRSSPSNSRSPSHSRSPSLRRPRFRAHSPSRPPSPRHAPSRAHTRAHSSSRFSHTRKDTWLNDERPTQRRIIHPPRSPSPESPRAYRRDGSDESDADIECLMGELERLPPTHGHGQGWGYERLKDKGKARARDRRHTDQRHGRWDRGSEREESKERRGVGNGGQERRARSRSRDRDIRKDYSNSRSRSASLDRQRARSKSASATHDRRSYVKSFSRNGASERGDSLRGEVSNDEHDSEHGKGHGRGLYGKDEYRLEQRDRSRSPRMDIEDAEASQASSESKVKSRALPDMDTKAASGENTVSRSPGISIKGIANANVHEMTIASNESRIQEPPTSTPLLQRIRAEPEPQNNSAPPLNGGNMRRIAPRSRPRSLLTSVQAHLGKGPQFQRPPKRAEAATGTILSYDTRGGESTRSSNVANKRTTNPVPSLLLRMSDDPLLSDSTLTPIETPSTPSTPLTPTAEHARLSAPSIMARTRTRLAQIRPTPPTTVRYPPNTPDPSSTQTEPSSDQPNDHEKVDRIIAPTPDLSLILRGAATTSNAQLSKGHEIHPRLSDTVNNKRPIDVGVESDAECNDGDPDLHAGVYSASRRNGGHGHEQFTLEDSMPTPLSSTAPVLGTKIAEPTINSISVAASSTSCSRSPQDYRTRLLDKLALERHAISPSTANGASTHDPASPLPLSRPISSSPSLLHSSSSLNLASSSKSTLSIRESLDCDESSGAKGQSMGAVSMDTTPGSTDISSTALREDRPLSIHPLRQGIAGPMGNNDASRAEGDSANDEMEKRLRAQAQLRVRLAAAKRIGSSNSKAMGGILGGSPQSETSGKDTVAGGEGDRKMREERLRQALLARTRSG